MAWGIFDGHSGWGTADVLEKQLLPFIRHSLSEYEEEEFVTDSMIRLAITRGFTKLDHSIVKSTETAVASHEPAQDKVKKFVLSFAGSCALLSIYDPSRRNVHVACTGNSRAVLGKEETSGEWLAKQLSEDQTGFSKLEARKLDQEHYNEKMIQNGRLFGLEVTRAFGDGFLKWPLSVTTYLIEKWTLKASLAGVRTPPYLTAGPKVTTTKIDTKPSFIIMASDGLWDMMSSKQAVELVAKWLNMRKPMQGSIRESMQKPMWEPVQKPMRKPMREPVQTPMQEPVQKPLQKLVWDDIEKSKRLLADLPNLQASIAANNRILSRLRHELATGGAVDDDDGENSGNDEGLDDDLDVSDGDEDDENFEDDEDEEDDEDTIMSGVESIKVNRESSQGAPEYAAFHFGRFKDGMIKKFVKARTTIQDDNAAVHLVRNALGGNHHELIASRLAFNNGSARHVRDNITVQVIFFNFPYV
ncbi:phosphatase 2C-like domain-containing protein [Ustulina deusta]|nr:phosphatase 2C-like domain-containing protein [Ustulina deusta]